MLSFWGLKTSPVAFAVLRIRISIKLNGPDPHQNVWNISTFSRFWAFIWKPESDPDPHQSKTEDSDPDPHHGDKQDQDPHQRDKLDPDPHQSDADPNTGSLNALGIIKLQFWSKKKKKFQLYFSKFLVIKFKTLNPDSLNLDLQHWLGNNFENLEWTIS